MILSPADVPSAPSTHCLLLELPSEVLHVLVASCTITSILQLRQTCVKLSNLTRDRFIWSAVLNQLLCAMEVVPHSVPQELMTSQELEACCVAHLRFRQSLRTSVYATPIQPACTRILTSSTYVHHEHRALDVAPGGRILFTVTGNKLFVWDIGCIHAKSGVLLPSKPVTSIELDVRLDTEIWVNGISHEKDELRIQITEFAQQVGISWCFAYAFDLVGENRTLHFLGQIKVLSTALFWFASHRCVMFRDPHRTGVWNIDEDEAGMWNETTPDFSVLTSRLTEDNRTVRIHGGRRVTVFPTPSPLPLNNPDNEPSEITPPECEVTGIFQFLPSEFHDERFYPSFRLHSYLAPKEVMVFDTFAQMYAPEPRFAVRHRSVLFCEAGDGMERWHVNVVHDSKYDDLALNNATSSPYLVVYPDAWRLLWWMSVSQVHVHISSLTPGDGRSSAGILFEWPSPRTASLAQNQITFDPFSARFCIADGKELRIVDFVGPLGSD
ncbi:hypothetical protein DL96DRAFT_905460 [Flagelloscypha sp. PMI_526]|nr:hypothetical protein DL96DRAFT_905460 [Flagelloscypha sp. PMI_526]